MQCYSEAWIQDAIILKHILPVRDHVDDEGLQTQVVDGNKSLALMQVAKSYMAVLTDLSLKVGYASTLVPVGPRTPVSASGTSWATMPHGTGIMKITASVSCGV